MKITLSNYKKNILLNCSNKDLIKEIINIIYSYAMPYENKFEDLQKQISIQRYKSKIKNALLSSLIYGMLGTHYRESALDKNPEGYVEIMEKKVKELKMSLKTIRGRE